MKYIKTKEAKINDYHRFTEKDYDGYKLSSLWCGGTGAEAVQKLGQLEDLLEKHNIKLFNDLDNRLKALKFIKDTCKLKIYKNKLGQCFLEGTDILYAISQEEYDLLKEVLL